MQRLLRYLADHFSTLAVGRLDTPFEVPGLDFDTQVVPALKRLAEADPPYVVGVDVVEADYPVVVTGLTERGWESAELTGVPMASGTSLSGTSTSGISTLSAEQIRLLEAIYEPFVSSGVWPVFEWVEHELSESGLEEVCAALTAMPVIARFGGTRYGVTWCQGSSFGWCMPDDRVGLTVAGMAQLPQAAPDVDLFLATLRHLADCHRTAPRSPQQVQPIEATSEQVADFLATVGSHPSWLQLGRLKEILSYEPPTRGGGGGTTPDGSWRIGLTNSLREYRDVGNVDDYLTCVVRSADRAAKSSPALLAAQAFPQPLTAAFPFTRPLTPPPPTVVRPQPGPWDVFISHASEDKDAVARPLSAALIARGYRVWLDENELKIGDHLLECIDHALESCRHGVVILSPAFFAKRWTQRELDGLTTREIAGIDIVVLPVWHNVNRDDVARYSLPLANRFAGNTEHGIESVADRIAESLGPPRAEPANPAV
jgi:hypothetical protein